MLEKKINIKLICSTYNNFFFINYSDPLQRLNLSPPVKAHAFVTLGKLHQPKKS